MQTCPKDILCAIFSFFDYKDILSSLSLVCKEWRKICDNENMWKQFCFKEGIECINFDWKNSFRLFKTSRYAVITGAEDVNLTYAHLVSGGIKEKGLIVDHINAAFEVPSMKELLKYEAVLMYSIDGHSFKDGVLMGDRITEYVIEHGRGVVVCVFANCSNLAEGWLKGKFLDLHPQKPMSQGTYETLEIGKIHEKNHPVYTQADLCPGPVNPEARSIASWTNGVNKLKVVTVETIMLSERIVPNGKILGLNLFPVPDTNLEWKNGVWVAETDGFTLMASCLKYANSSYPRYKWNMIK